MTQDLRIDTVDTHTAGEPTRIVVDGLPAGVTDGGAIEARDRFRTEYDHLRRFLMHEPRGHRDMFGAVLMDPADESADIGCFFMDTEGYLDMCGHGLIGTVTYLIEYGQIEPPIDGPLVVETPAGLVRAWPEMTDGSVQGVTIENVDSFVLGTETVTVDGTPLEVSIVYGGNTFALVNVAEVGLELEQSQLRKLIELALTVRDLLNTDHRFTHPVTGEPLEVELVECYDEQRAVPANVTVFSDGQVDRSPCGTGTCAKMAMLYDRDALAVGDHYHYESIIGTRFTGEIVDTVDQDGHTAIIPRITGSAYAIAESTFIRDTADTLAGFRL